nr:FAD-dependent oxidoreductase [Helicobacter sp. MIT 05-5293]
MKCKELDSDFAAQRIKGLNLYEAIKSAFFGDKNKKHKTLVDAFNYPKKGCGVVYENMKNEILKKGGKIHLNCKVLGIKTKNKKAYSILTDKGEYQADIIVSSAPFKEMVCSLGELDKDITDLASKLKFRNTILVYVEADSETKLFEDNWIYVHSPHVQTGRITNFANWTKDLQCGRKENILALEYWANDDEKLWNLSDEELINIAKKDLIDSALLKPQDIKRSFVLKLHKSYPVYERGYKENLNKIYTALDSFSHLYFIGRNGSFKYNNQDHSILMGLACADKILGKAVNLWHINTDYDYQEDSHIPESAANDKR